jgi:hypothetical protein
MLDEEEVCDSIQVSRDEQKKHHARDERHP